MSEPRQQPVPAWFPEALACEPVRASVVVCGASIELLTWGELGKPGLLFLHGSGAHADWWSFIAPSFAGQWRVAAISWSGMGRSGWRERYSLPLYVEELWAASDAAGLNQSREQPVVVAHSFGGLPALQAGVQHPERLRGIAFLDCRLRVRPLVQPGAGTQHRIYPDEHAILQRFRFVPPDTGTHPYLREFIARHSIRRVASPGEGWTWCFDPERRTKMQYLNPQRMPADLRVPAALISGGLSSVVTPEQRELFQNTAPNLRQIVLAEAGHHLMVDQPLALIDALRSLLASWSA